MNRSAVELEVLARSQLASEIIARHLAEAETRGRSSSGAQTAGVSDLVVGASPPDPGISSLFSVNFTGLFGFMGLATASDLTTFDFQIPNATSHEFTVAVWAKPLLTSPNATLFALGDLGQGANRINLQHDTGDRHVFVDVESLSPFRIKRYSTSAGSIPATTDDVWVHTAISYTPDSLRVYVAGLELATTKSPDNDLSAIVPRDSVGRRLLLQRQRPPTEQRPLVLHRGRAAIGSASQRGEGTPYEASPQSLRAAAPLEPPSARTRHRSQYARRTAARRALAYHVLYAAGRDHPPGRGAAGSRCPR